MLKLLLLLLPFAAILPAAADSPRNITAGEIARLPDYCAHTQTFERNGSKDSPTEAQRYWAARIGESFWDLHHYCWAMVSANRAQAAGVSRGERIYLYDSAVNDCYYILQNMKSSFPLLPEMLTRMAQYRMSAEKPAEALQFYERARAAKPDYWPPYVGIADLQVKLGRPAAAREVLQAGLALMPDEPRLRERLAQLDSTRRAPAPRRAASAAAQAPKAAAAASRP
jgi:tetratricopeptide (TPR) repeat protein